MLRVATMLTVLTSLAAAAPVSSTCFTPGPTFWGHVLVQLRTNLTPIADFEVVRTTMQSMDHPDQRDFITEHVVDGGRDYAAGVRVAFFDPVFFDRYRVLIELVDGDGFTIASRTAVNIEIDDDTIRVLTLLVTDDTPPPDLYGFRTHFTSEETVPAMCHRNSAAVGLECAGRFCDNVRLTCRPVPGGLGAERWTSFFSDEKPGLNGCKPNELVTGLACRGCFCDEISLRCAQIPGTIASCALSEPISEEGPPFLADGTSFIRAMSCSGDFCDNKRLEVCSLNEPLWTSRLFFDLCVSVSGWSEGPLDEGAELIVSRCRDLLTGNLDQRWHFLNSGFIANPEAGVCMTAGQGNFLVGPCSNDNPARFIPDAAHRLRSVDDRSLCLTAGGQTKPWERPEEFGQLILAPCGNRADQQWELPGVEPPLFADGFESGDSVAWSSSSP